MPTIDPFLAVLTSSRADVLHLADGAAAALEQGGRRRSVTKQPLTRAQLLGLLKEIAPPAAMHDLARGVPVAFAYTGGADAYRVIAEGGPDTIAVRITIDGNAGSNGAVTEDAPASEEPAEHGTASAVAASGGNGSSPNGANGAGATVDPERHSEMDALLRLLVEQGGSDLHLRVGEPPMLRVDGELRRIDGQARLENARVEGMLSSIMPDRNRQEFADSADTDFAYEIGGLARFRANALRDRNGAAAVFRVIPAKVFTVDQMGVSEEVRKLCYLTKGLVLVTGPTGSGKSTTLCSLVDLVNRERNDHVITIEDPIEFVHENKSCLITQRQVGVHTKSFKQALRAALREDPDIILVGELRDLETVSIAIETAETGHLVFGTLHTTTAASTVDRLIDQFPADRQEQIRQMLAESLKGVISQTLCKKIGGGRVAAREILLSMPSVANLIREGKTFQIPSIMQTSRRLGMVTLNDALLELVDANQVEPKEAYMKAVDKPGILAALKSRGREVGFAEEGGGKKELGVRN
jgi:twitching motility protein PilT